MSAPYNELADKSEALRRELDDAREALLEAVTALVGQQFVIHGRPGTHELDVVDDDGMAWFCSMEEGGTYWCDVEDMRLHLETT